MATMHPERRFRDQYVNDDGTTTQLPLSEAHRALIGEIQRLPIALTGGGEHPLTVLCNDGTLWEQRPTYAGKWEWAPVKPIPQP
jgi:hypothetical protein